MDSNDILQAKVSEYFRVPCVCRRQRELKPGQSPYRALLDTLELSDSSMTLQLINDNNKVRCLYTAHISFLYRFNRQHELVCMCLQVRLLLELYRLQGNMTRVQINELKPLKTRYEVPDVLISQPRTEP